ncbi:MAG: peptidyl-prolyl cis-trans isomerase [Elusimicrobia bacterium]|nr:peptidyl-prolyl cis-trans isomerase [Elusimicrobiota bacterium]
MKNLLLLCTAAGLLAAPARAEGDRDIVSVNGTTIRQSEVMDRLWKRFGPGTLDEMIDELLLRQASRSAGLKPDEGEVERRFKKLKAQFDNPALFENQLKRDGSSEEKLKAELAEQIVLRKLIVSAHKLSVADEELRKTFQDKREKLASPETAHLHQIFVKTEAEAKEVVAKLKDGADFAALARAKSLAPTGQYGGDYGFVPRDMLPDEIGKIVFSMKDGEVRVVSSAQGFFVLKVSGRKPSRPARFEEVKDDLRDVLLQQKMKAVLPDYLQELRRKAEIKPLGGKE